MSQPLQAFNRISLPLVIIALTTTLILSILNRGTENVKDRDVNDLGVQIILGISIALVATVLGVNWKYMWHGECKKVEAALNQAVQAAGTAVTVKPPLVPQSGSKNLLFGQNW